MIMRHFFKATIKKIVPSNSLNGLSLCKEAPGIDNDATKAKADELKSNLMQMYILRIMLSKKRLNYFIHIC